MRIAFYEKQITPPLGCYLTGYYVNHVAQDVTDDLHVRCAALEQGETTAFILCVDTCELPEDLHDAVTRRITEYTGIDKANVLISATHTHKGIPISDSPEIGAYCDAAFKDVVYRLIADCAILAYRRLVDGSVFYAAGKAEGVSFNRNFIRKDGKYVTWAGKDAVAPLSGTDTEVPILFMKDAKGTPVGAIVNFACHQDCVPGSVYSGDYANVLSEALKNAFGKHFVTVFLIGTCGDINHINPALNSMPADTYIKIGNTLADAVLSAYEGATFTGDLLKVSKKRIPVLRRVYTEAEAIADIRRFADTDDRFALRSIRNLSYYLACVPGSDTEVYVQCMQIGDCALYGYPGEVFVNFGLDLKARSPFQKNLVATQCNTSCGYIATREAHSENSLLYEKALCFAACLDKEAGYIITDALIDMAHALTQS